MEGCWHDLKAALRGLSRNPGFTVIVALALGLGIGTTTLVFTIVDGALLSPLPFADPDRLVALEETYEGEYRPVSMANFVDWRRHADVFAGMAITESRDFTLITTESSGHPEPQRVAARRVSDGFFPLLGVEPVRGRWLTADSDAGDTGEVVLSYGFWRRRFGGDPAMIGRVVSLDGTPHVVVGVMPPAFRWYDTRESSAVDVWTRLPVRMTGRKQHQFRAVARLERGVRLAVAQQQMDAITLSLARQYPDTNGGFGVRVERLGNEVERSAPALLVLFGAVGFVLAIACANVASLLLARAITRRGEVAVRMALGAGRWRIVRQLLAESLLLSAVGGAVGFWLAILGLSALPRAVPDSVSLGWLFQPDVRTLAFAAVVTLITGLLFGLAPALTASRTDLECTLRVGGRGTSTAESRGRHRLSALVVFQIALALVLLAGAGLLIKSFAILSGVDLGMRTDGVLTMRLDVSQDSCPTEADCRRLYADLLERVRMLPDAESAAEVSALPLSGWRPGAEITVGGSEPAVPWASRIAVWHAVTSGYFRTLEIPVLRGRSFSALDGPGDQRVMLVNETMARQTWPGASPLGETVTAWGRRYLVVGIVGDVRRAGPLQRAEAEVFVPFAQEPGRGMFLVVRTSSNPMGLAAPIRAQLQDLDPTVPISRLRTMDEALGEAVWRQRSIAVLLVLFAAGALGLAALGLFGVVAYSVARRTHEIGVRASLGASRRDILALVVREAMTLTLVGGAIGLVASLVLTRFIQGLLFGTEPIDPPVFAGVVLLLAAVALVASLLAARRAASVDPMVALRRG